jgi:hypothetical protein
MADFAQAESGRGGEPQLEHHRPEVIAMRIGILLNHVFERQALEHAMDGRALESGAAREVEQARSGTVMRGDFAHEQQCAFDALSAGEAGRVVFG